MSNRAYLYSLSQRPTSCQDRPETISGLSEWPYEVPFMYRLLMSGDPQLCASLMTADDNESDVEQGGGAATEGQTMIYAISSRFDAGYDRVKRFVEILSHIASHPPLLPGSSAHKPRGAMSLLDRLKELVSSTKPPVTAASVHSAATTVFLAECLKETIAFLDAHRDAYLLLETIEIDSMSTGDSEALKQAVEEEIRRCVNAGAAVDALHDDIHQAAQQVREAVARQSPGPSDAFFGLRLDDDFDNTGTGATEYPLGLEWCDELCVELLNRRDFQALSLTSA